MLNVTAPCVVAAVAQRQLKSLCCLHITDTKTTEALCRCLGEYYSVKVGETTSR